MRGVCRIYARTRVYVPLRLLSKSKQSINRILKATTIEPEKYLNIFTCNGDETLGSSMFPDESFRPSDKRWAVMLSDYSLPGFTDDMQGDTATHEIGQCTHGNEPPLTCRCTC